jgi:hypothetical protein
LIQLLWVPEEWLKEIRVGRIFSKKRRTPMKPATVAGYESAVTWLSNVIADKPLPDIKTKLLGSWLLR